MNLDKWYESEEGREALRVAEELIEMIIFHENARKNSIIMSETWEM